MNVITLHPPVRKDLVELVGDMECGEGSVEFSSAFLQENELMQADLLRDWMLALNAKYAEIIGSNFLEDA